MAEKIKNQIFQYNGSPITFQSGNGVMVNATQMARVFDKRPVDWLNLQSTKDFLNELWKIRSVRYDVEVRNPNFEITRTNEAGLVNILKCFDKDLHLVATVRGGNNLGTWMHEDVALEFARWLSPAFAIWCNDRIKELLTQGVATVTNDDEAILHAINVLQKRVESYKQQNQMLESENTLYKDEIKTLAPKAEYADEVLQSVSSFTTTQIAKGLGLSAVTLNQKLRDLGVQFYQSGQWFLTSRYQNKQLTEQRICRYTNMRTGDIETSQTMVWTERGRMFIHNLRKIGKL